MSTRGALPDVLRALRAASGLSQTAVCKQAGISQARISRAETGRGLLSEDELKVLCRLYQAPVETRRELLDKTRALQESRTPARMVLQRGGWEMQERIGRLESAAGSVRSFAPSAIVGLLQTRSYIKALFGESLSPDDRDRTIQARLDRQAVLDTDREFVFVMGEGALRWCMGSAATMTEQLQHLETVSQLANVRVGIVAQSTPTTVPGLHPFTLYDSQAVLVGTWNATAIISDSRNVGDYLGYWEELQPFVSWDDDARAVIGHIRSGYRSRS